MPGSGVSPRPQSAGEIPVLRGAACPGIAVPAASSTITEAKTICVLNLNDIGASLTAARWLVQLEAIMNRRPSVWQVDTVSECGPSLSNRGHNHPFGQTASGPREA